MKIEWNRKYNTIAVYVLIVVAILALFVMAVFNLGGIMAAVSKTLGILMPIIVGVVIAFILNPIVMFFERRLFRPLFKKKPRHKLARALSVTVTLVLTFAAIAGMIAVVIPELVDSITQLATKSSDYVTNVQDWFDQFLDSNPALLELINNNIEDIGGYMAEYADKLKAMAESFVTQAASGVLGFLDAMMNFGLGIIASVYLLYGKESFLAQGKKVMFALFPKKFCFMLLRQYHKANKIFMGSVTGELVDSLIVGMVCFIGLTVLRMPYVVLISLIIGVTNIIPFFGPFIGAIPSAVLIFMVNPIQTIWFIIFITALQQIDGNILKPRILGDTTGLPAFWAMFALILGGGLFGLAGMLLGVPVFAVIYMIIRAIVENILRKKRLPVPTSDYNGPIEVFEQEPQPDIPEGGS